MPNTSKEDFLIPDSIFNIYENLIIFDLHNKKTYITELGYIENSTSLILEKLKEYKEFDEVRFEESNNIFYSNFEKEEYEDAIRKLKDYIRSGDVYIANMTRRIWCEILLLLLKYTKN